MHLKLVVNNKPKPVGWMARNKEAAIIILWVGITCVALTALAVVPFLLGGKS